MWLRHLALWWVDKNFSEQNYTFFFRVDIYIALGWVAIGKKPLEIEMLNVVLLYEVITG
jgi:hypothetical protein